MSRPAPPLAITGEARLDRGMVARTASQADGAASRVAVAFDGSVATMFESSRVTVLALPDGTAFAEIGVDPDAVASEVGWIGQPPRLLVLSRYPAHCTAHLLDPHGPRTIAEIRLESPVRLYATVGASALVIGALGPAILTASETHLTMYPFPSRVSPLAAGAAGAQFVVALPSAIEEWDPVGRVPRRRLRLPRAAAITGVGGSDRVVWMTTQQEPSRIDVIPLVNRGQPRGHELPEPILSIAGHPRSDVVACIGAETGQLYVIDLDGRMRMRTLAPDTAQRVESAALIVGRTTSVLASQAGRQLAVLALDSRDPLLEATRPRTAPPAATPAATADEVIAIEEPGNAEDASTVEDAVEDVHVAGVVAADETDAGEDHRRSWRDEVVAWSREFATATGDVHVPVAPAFEVLAGRFDLSPALLPALVLLYAAHLCGERGVAPVDLARLLDGAWHEALGRGELAARNIAYYAASRVALSPLVLRVLDELPPATGVLVGRAGPLVLRGPCIAVAGDEPLAEVAERCIAQVGGAILAAHHDAEPAAVLFEARACGAVAMLRATPAAPPREVAIFVVGDTELAERLGMPRVV
jgi:hypothetical protein